MMAMERRRFDEAYFRTTYRDCQRQTPPRKMRFYRKLAEKVVGDLQRPRVLDIGCAFGAFLSTLDTRWHMHGMDVSEHVPSLEGVLDSVEEKLEPRGHFLFVVPVYDGPAGPIVRPLDRDVTHLHKESRRFWLEWVTRRLELVEWWGICRYLLPWGYYVHQPTRWLRAIAPAIAVLAQSRVEWHG